MYTRRVVKRPGDQPYPGCTGVLTPSDRHILNAADREGLRENIEEFLLRSRERDRLFAELAFAAAKYRKAIELDETRTTLRREQNLRDYLKRAEKCDPLARHVLSGVNQEALGWTCGRSDENLADRARKLLLILPRHRRGKPDDDSSLIMAVSVRQIYLCHFGCEPSCAKGSDFTRLLEIVAEAATGQQRKSLHSLAERVREIREEEYGPGVQTWPLPRFARET